MFSKERLEYLRENQILFPISAMKLKKLRNSNISQTELDQAEFILRFQAYEKKQERLWKKLNWGEAENEDLAHFALSSLDQEIYNSQNSKKI